MEPIGPLMIEHRLIMDNLLKGHNYLREKLSVMEQGYAQYLHGDTGALLPVSDSLDAVAGFYPRHTDEEDKRFFFPALKYFSSQERDAMLRRFEEHDRELFHREYRDLVGRLEASEAVREKVTV